MSPTLRFLFGAGTFLLAHGNSAMAEEETPTPFVGQLSLVRYDLPRGLSDGYAPTRQLARREDGVSTVDWPEFTFNDQPIFRDAAEERVNLKVRPAAESMSFFQMEGDEVIEPGNHWFRAIQWLPGRRHVYTADKTARGGNAGSDASGRYELWTFPIRIEGAGAPVVKNVVLKTGGRVVYKKPGPWRSLTLLLPANERGKPYELNVDGRPPVQFNVGLQPVKLGDPRELAYPVEATLSGGGGSKITVRNLARPDEFPHARAWAEDVGALGRPLPSAPTLERDPQKLGRYLGIEVPRSPLLIYAAALPHGMSGGFYGQGGREFAGSLDQYADTLADLGFDAVFEHAATFGAPDEAGSFEQRATAFAQRGLLLGLQYDNNSNRPSLQNANLGFLAHTLSEWHAPLYRSLQLAAQRFARWPNFLGLAIGANDAGYAPTWASVPPTPSRPWGEAMYEFFGEPQARIPCPPGLAPLNALFERVGESQDQFARILQRYDASYRQYGYFAEAVRDIDPQLVFTTGSFGSAPGANARGGWPSASLPGRVMFEGLNVQQAYDSNQTHASKPLHEVALIDRLASYFPEKKTWTLIDNHQFLFGREAFQRAYALALTRGVQGVGTNFLPLADSHLLAGQADEQRAFTKEMHGWMRKFGGVYAATKPLATIGVFYSHHQALQRRTVTGGAPTPEKLYGGSHEGKVTEALFLCHAAGWPARVITYQEVMRGPLPDSMQAVLLVGLDASDGTWSWGPGLEPAWRAFLARGGRILVDDESVCDVPTTPTGLRVASYVAQSNLDATPLLLERNAANIERLRAAIQGVPPPIAASENPRLWAIPTECGTTQYATAVNQAFAEGDEAKEMLLPPDRRATKPERWKTKANASRFVKPQTGTLQWHTSRPIYDVRLGRKLSIEEAANVDLTTDAFRWYALPVAEVVPPEVAFAVGASGFWEAKATMRNGVELTGVPVSIAVQGPRDVVTVFGATGQIVRLPINQWTDSGEFPVTITELLTQQMSTTTLRSAIPPMKPSAPAAVTLRQPLALAKFADRKHVSLNIALTTEQERDGDLMQHVRTLAEFYEKHGRHVTIGRATPGGVVESLQPLKSPHRYPQWKTIPSDLVLFGTPASNVLLLDQARGEILPRESLAPAAGHAEVVCTRSPFVGEYDVVNVLAGDAQGVGEAVRALSELK